jgi:hypothetical protein
MIKLKQILKEIFLRESWDRFVSLGDQLVASIYKNPERYEIEEEIFNKYQVETARGFIDIKSKNIYAYHDSSNLIFGIWGSNQDLNSVTGIHYMNKFTIKCIT